MRVLTIYLRRLRERLTLYYLVWTVEDYRAHRIGRHCRSELRWRGIWEESGRNLYEPTED
jgi:hypothetical protein